MRCARIPNWAHKYKKPDLQIYRPGMGRFSTKKPQEKKEDEVKMHDEDLTIVPVSRASSNRFQSAVFIDD